MPKARVYELAKELGVDSKTVLSKLEAMGEFVKSASSTVEPPVARKLRNAFASSGQDNASDSKKPRPYGQEACRTGTSHLHAKPAAPSAPSGCPRSAEAASCRFQVRCPEARPSRAASRRIPPAWQSCLTATLRVRRVETAASPVARRPFRELAPAHNGKRSAGRQQRQWREAAHPGTAPGQQSVQPQAGHAHPDSG